MLLLEHNNNENITVYFQKKIYFQRKISRLYKHNLNFLLSSSGKKVDHFSQRN